MVTGNTEFGGSAYGNRKSGGHVKIDYIYAMFLTVYTNIFFSLVFIGGLIGFLKRGSKASVIAGTISALLIALGIYWFDTSMERQITGLYLLVGVSAFLAIFAIVRLIRTGKLMPAGLILLLSIAELNLLWLWYLQG